MQVMVECIRLPNITPTYIGPFSSVEDAQNWLLLPIEGWMDREVCPGKHRILDLVKPDRTRTYSESAVLDVVSRAKDEFRVQMARETQPFVVKGESPLGNVISGKIATIKELRLRFRIGLKEAKDIVEEWERTGEVTFD